ncbi:MAG: cytochrome C oxidase subunit IV family protein [Planctomycetes bacterium]|nr:cytochrome C oxidase subunit IV family protein [Planctomycetota bacterium]
MIVPRKLTAAVFVALLALTGSSVGAAYLDLGVFNTILALAIAGVKASLVALYFMHLRYSSKLVWLFAGGSFFWLGILLALTLNDYLTR